MEGKLAGRVGALAVSVAAVATACGGDLPSQTAPEPLSTPTPSITEAKSSHGPTTIERHAIERKLSDFTRKPLDDFQKEVNRLKGEKIDLDVDRNNWMVGVSEDRDGSYNLLNVTPPAKGYQDFQLEVKPTELSELAATGFYGVKEGGEVKDVFPLTIPVHKHLRVIVLGFMEVNKKDGSKARFRLEVPLT